MRSVASVKASMRYELSIRSFYDRFDEQLEYELDNHVGSLPEFPLLESSMILVPIHHLDRSTEQGLFRSSPLRQHPRARVPPVPHEAADRSRSRICGPSAIQMLFGQSLAAHASSVRILPLITSSPSATIR